MGIDRKVKRGHVLVSCQHRKKLLQLFKPTGYRGGKTGGQRNRTCIRIRTSCLFFLLQDAPGNIHYFNFTATVNYVDEDRMVIVLPSADALLSIQATERQLGVQLYFDEPVPTDV